MTTLRHMPGARKGLPQTQHFQSRTATKAAAEGFGGLGDMEWGLVWVGLETCCRRVLRYDFFFSIFLHSRRVTAHPLHSQPPYFTF